MSRLAMSAILSLGIACHARPAALMHVHAGSQRIANLHAFARLYGVVRWFHPSDAASEIDWQRFAVDGVRRILDAPDARALRAALGELFAPVAPTVHLVAAGEPFANEPALHPDSSKGLDIIAWQHSGYGDSAVSTVFASKRRHRDRIAPVEGRPWGAVWQAVDATPYRGARLRLRGKLRVRPPARAQLWVRVERGDAKGFVDEMWDRPAVRATWDAVELAGPIDADATRIVFGALSSGGSATWYDEIDLAVQRGNGSWEAVQIGDPGFEATDPLVSWRPGFAKPSVPSLAGWKATPDHDHPASGASSLRLEPETRLVTEELFSEVPRPAETVDVDLGAGLRARVPIALYSRNGHTIGDDPEAARRAQATPAASESPRFDALAGIADIVVAWNVLEHFWPYWDTVSVDWLAELDTALRDALDDRSIDDHVATLLRLSAALPDGHAEVTCPGTTRSARPPFAVDVVEGEIVVTASADPAIERGDVIVSIDGRPAMAELAEHEALASGSPQFRRLSGCMQFGTGPIGSTVALRVRRGASERSVTVPRGDKTIDEAGRPAIEQFENGVYYVDLSRAAMPDLDQMMSRLAAAPGVVFDVRRRPNSTRAILSHLLTRPDEAEWLALPRVIRPDHVPSAIAGWETGGWGMPVLEPHIAGRVAFLTGPRAYSYAESIMGLVEYHHLGEIVGSTTAGTNGNIAQIVEPTGCSTQFTGLRVTKPDGSRHHLVGVHPTIPVTRTIAGVAAGRDEELEKALAYVRTGVK